MILVEKYTSWEGNFGDPESAYVFAGIYESVDLIPDEVYNAKTMHQVDYNSKPVEINLYRIKDINVNTLY